MKIVIDASGELNGESIAARDFNNKTILDHWLETALLYHPDSVLLVAGKFAADISEALKGRYDDVEINITEDIPRDKGACVIGGNKIYRTSRIRVFDDPSDLEDNVAWTILTVDDISHAENEYIKSKWFPIAKYYIEPCAKILAKALSRSRIMPNHLTWAGFGLGIMISFLLAFGNEGARRANAIFLLIYWLLDITDGKLARLKNLVSRFGGWLDAVTGEAVDFLIYLAVVCNIYITTRSVAILWLGIFYFIGKYLFITSMREGQERFSDRKEKDLFTEKFSKENKIVGMMSAVHFLHDSDVRIHFMALAILIDLAWFPLLVYAVYYNLWFIAKIMIETYRFETHDKKPVKKENFHK